MRRSRSWAARPTNARSPRSWSCRWRLTSSCSTRSTAASSSITEDFDRGDGEKRENNFLDRQDHGDRVLAEEPLTQLLQGDFRRQLVAAIAELPEREQLLLSLYYDEELTLREIGAVLDVTQSRVCQLHSQCYQPVARRPGRGAGLEAAPGAGASLQRCPAAARPRVAKATDMRRLPFAWAGGPGRGCRQQLTFASPKESKQRKGDPQSGSLRFASGNLRCSTTAGSRANSPSAQTSAIPDPPTSALLGPARTGQSGSGKEDRKRKHKEDK